MVIDSYGKKLLRPVLTYHILVKELVDFLRFMKRLDLAKRLGSSRLAIEFLKIISGQLYTIRTDASIKSLKQK